MNLIKLLTKYILLESKQPTGFKTQDSIYKFIEYPSRTKKDNKESDHTIYINEKEEKFKEPQVGLKPIEVWGGKVEEDIQEKLDVLIKSISKIDIGKYEEESKKKPEEIIEEIKNIYYINKDVQKAIQKTIKEIKEKKLTNPKWKDFVENVYYTIYEKEIPDDYMNKYNSYIISAFKELKLF